MEKPNIRVCPFCGAAVTEAEEFCTACGFRVGTAASRQPRLSWQAAGCLVLVALGAGGAGSCVVGSAALFLIGEARTGFKNPQAIYMVQPLFYGIALLGAAFFVVRELMRSRRGP